MARERSTRECHLPLCFNLTNCLCIHRQLKNPGHLAFSQTRQEHDPAIWKFQRIVVGGDPFFIDLSKDRRLVFDHLIRTTQYTKRLTFNQPVDLMHSI
jgi:hypothetical protein